MATLIEIMETFDHNRTDWTRKGTDTLSNLLDRHMVSWLVFLLVSLFGLNRNNLCIVCGRVRNKARVIGR